MSENIFQKRRAYVSEKFAEKTTGSKMSNQKKAKLMKSLWREAKRKYPK